MAAWKRSSPAFFCPKLAPCSWTRPPLLKRGQSLDPLPNQYKRLIIVDNESARTRSTPGQTAEGFAVCSTTRSPLEALVMDDCRRSETTGWAGPARGPAGPARGPARPARGPAGLARGPARPARGPARPARGPAGPARGPARPARVPGCVSAARAVAWFQRPGACWEQSRTPTRPGGQTLSWPENQRSELGTAAGER